MNIPNALTGLRFLMIPLYCWVFSIEPEAKFWSAAIFVLASLTDVLDGYIARKYDMTTKWGQLMDPLADKLMQIAVIITMVLAGIVPNWFVMVLVIKECLFIFGSICLYTEKNVCAVEHIRQAEHRRAVCGNDDFAGVPGDEPHIRECHFGRKRRYGCLCVGFVPVFLFSSAEKV